MKKHFILLLLLLPSLAYSQAPTLNVRNSLLGIYTGTYWDFYHAQPVVTAGCRITALPNDSMGIIINDTLNNLIDTFYVGYWYDVNHIAIVDTVLRSQIGNDEGDIFPANDSIVYGRVTPDNFPNASAYSALTCVQHSFPTTINEDAIYTNLFPNPSSDILRIENKKNNITSYSIYNTTGQLIIENTLNSVNKVDITIGNLPIGFYYIKIKTPKGETTKRFIKN